ncbi:SdpI family protein [Chryseobacterium sp. MFBS3-17]|uniref:SdpI family protein n=1 Tax=Chryseobacterium sp. MFBS3-17 TaxID=2886689 RepID=UPI001D0DF7BA|nr:SdpI family protein [Chryseobacterium sp. MFBS3-17]
MIGYRTKRSMKNQRNWEYAQKNFFQKWLLVIPVMLFTQIPVFFGYDSERILELSFFEFLIISVYAIIDTERNLKKMDSNH